MKKQLFVIALIAVFLVSCTGFFDLRDEAIITDLGSVDEDGNPISKTHVWFDNSSNVFSVDIFNAHTRSSNSKVTDTPIPAQTSSNDVAALPTRTNEEFYYYLTYYVPVYEDLMLPYIPLALGFASVGLVIPYNERTKVPIYDLKTLIPADTLLINDVCIVIENNFATFIQFNRGSLVLQPENQSRTSINHGQKALYRINAANTAGGYTIIRTGTTQNLPAEITSLQRGHVYIIEYTVAGIPVLKDSFELNMGRFN